MAKSSKEKEVKYITKSGLKGKRGWTDLLIGRFLPTPDKYATNPHYKSGPEVQLFLLEKVDAVEQTPEFKVMKDSARLRQQSSRKAVNTKRNKILNYVRSLSIQLPDISKEDLIQKSVDSYNNFRSGRDFFEPATADSDWHFLNRICINYLRHQCSRYERELDNIFGKVGAEEAYPILKARVNEAILRKFDFLERLEDADIELPQLPDSDFGAEFSSCRKYRYALWRIWDRKKPMVMFIGLNPSTANEIDNDQTIKSVGRISKHNGFGGFYMMNCFPYVSTDPDKLKDFGNTPENDRWLERVAKACEAVVFAWGSFEIVKELGRDKELVRMFPSAKALFVNKNGSPKHPLYCKTETNFVQYQS